MPLERELAAFRAAVPVMLGPGDLNEGKYAVVSGETPNYPFDSYTEALGFGYRTYGVKTPFLVKAIERHESALTGTESWIAECAYWKARAAAAEAEIARLRGEA